LTQNTSRNKIKYLFAHNLQYLMEEHNKTRRMICSDLNIKYTTLCDWVNARSTPHEDQLMRLGEYFGIEAGEFFIELNSRNIESENNRYRKYAENRRLNMETINHMTDDQIRELLESGFTFEHKTLEEYINESGGKMIVSDEMDWGTPTGAEVW